MVKKSATIKEVPLSEIQFRRYEKPYDLKGRELIKKLCLSLGLLQPGDSRDIIVDIFWVMLKDRSNSTGISSEEVRRRAIEIRKEHSLSESGIASSNVRRQLKRLRDLFLIEKIRNNYRLNEGLSLSEIFSEKLEKYLIPTVLARVKDYISAVDEST